MKLEAYRPHIPAQEPSRYLWRWVVGSLCVVPQYSYGVDGGGATPVVVRMPPLPPRPTSSSAHRRGSLSVTARPQARQDVPVPLYVCRAGTDVFFVCRHEIANPYYPLFQFYLLPFLWFLSSHKLHRSHGPIAQIFCVIKWPANYVVWPNILKQSALLGLAIWIEIAQSILA